MTADVWAEELSSASYGGVELDVLATDDSIARALIQHVYPRKDGGDIVDFGAEPRVTTCRICFFERPPEREDTSRQNHLARLAAFLAAARRGMPQTFVHPITGRYQALVQNLTMRADAEQPNSVDVECTFVEDTTSPSAFDPGGRPLEAGEAAVSAEASQLDALAAEMALDSTVGADTATTIASWAARAEITARDVNAEMGRISSAIDDAIETYDLTTDPSAYPLYRSYQRLHYAARRAAERFRQAQPQIYEITLTVAKPLRVLVAENYGAADLETRYAEIQRLNDIDDPSLIPAGTTLRVPARTSSERVGR